MFFVLVFVDERSMSVSAACAEEIVLLSCLPCLIGKQATQCSFPHTLAIFNTTGGEAASAEPSSQAGARTAAAGQGRQHPAHPQGGCSTGTDETDVDKRGDGCKGVGECLS